MKLISTLIATLAISDVRSQAAHEDLLQHAESRFRATYDRDEFRAKQFQADWLPDSSGYTVLESAPDRKEQVRVRYDVASGKRTVPDAAQTEKPGRSGNLSPDGKRIVFSEQGNLYVRDQDSDRKIPLTKSVPDGPVSSSRAVFGSLGGPAHRLGQTLRLLRVSQSRSRTR